MVESGRWNRELDQKLIDMGREIGYDELVDYLFYLVPPHHSMPPSISLDETFEKALTKSQENWNHDTKSIRGEINGPTNPDTIAPIEHNYFHSKTSCTLYRSNG